MPKQPNKQLETVKQERNLLQTALQALAYDKHEGQEVFKYDGWRYRVRLYGANRAHGGIITHEGFFKGQRPTISAHYFDDYMSDVKRWFEASPAAYTKLYEAMFRLNNVRRLAWIDPLGVK